MPATTPIRILMLHGHAESSQKFTHKTRALREHITSFLSTTYPNRPVEYTFLDAPHDTEPCTPDLRTWGLGDFQVDKIRGLEESVKYILDKMAPSGPFDGIIGFSTGACMAVILGSLLEGGSGKASAKRGSVFNIPPSSNLLAAHPRLKFIIAYSAFMLGHPMYDQLYTPSLKTPILQYSCELDHIVPPGLTKALFKRCETAQLHSFYGTHYVPRSQESFEVVRRFIEEYC
ncbi:alpha/beta hydrolase [Aspergillus undulatus]|uniref:alpha/beta hydrolase n=1 Tax=Aspergillus undulatus TaxID=1810928 RepID=UPI003CCD4788